MKYFVVVSLVAVTPLAMAESFIQGHVVGPSECQGPAQIWIAKEKTQFYQAEVPIGGSFEFSLLPGNYEMSAETVGKCQAKMPISIGKNEIKSLEVQIKK